MQKGGDKYAEEKVAGPFFREEFGKGEEVAHGEGEEEVCGNGKHGPAKGDGSSVHGDVAYIFEGGKTHGGEYCVDDAVEVFVEVFALPCYGYQNYEFA